MAVHANRLLVIECKTSNQQFDSARNDQQFYKLDSLGQDARGLFGMVVPLALALLGRALVFSARRIRQ